METHYPSNSRIETIVAILIALATVIGAVVAWRASVADGLAGDADFAGLQAALRAEESRALTAVEAYEHFSSYVNYRRYNLQGELLAEAVAESDDLALERQQIESNDLALSSQFLFPNKFLDRDGSYNIKREMGELWADASKQHNLNPEPQFLQADKYRTKTNLLLGAVTILSIAVVFYTLVESVSARIRYVMVALGSFCFVGGSLFTLWIEFLF